MDYDRYGRDEAPAILQFVQFLRENDNKVDFFSGREELLSALRNRCYDAVAVSVFSSLELKELLKTLIEIKEADPCVTTILGGHGIKGFTQTLAGCQGVDIVVEGEADLTLPPVLKHIKRKEAEVYRAEVKTTPEAQLLGSELAPLLKKECYSPATSVETAESILEESFTRRVEFKDQELEIKVPLSQIFINTSQGLLSSRYGSRSFIERAEALNPGLKYDNIKLHLRPFPNAREVDLLYTSYPWDIIEDRGYTRLSLYVQRGCNWNACTYCSIGTLPGRRVSPEKVLRVLSEAKEHGIKEVTFDDDQFVQSKSWCLEVLDGIIERRLNSSLAFGAMMRVDALNDISLIKKMKKANFVKIQVGVESFIPEKIEYFHKVPRGREEEYTSRARALIDSLLKEGIDAGVFIITTRPREEKALVEICREVEEILKIAKASLEEYSRLPTFSFSDFLMAYPGAPLLEREEYKEILVPIKVSTPDKAIIQVLRVPYMFEFKTSALLGFFSSLRELSIKRGLAPEIKNETLEHMEDILLALKITAQSLDSEAALKIESVFSALNLLSEAEANRLARNFGVDRKNLRGYLLRRVQSDFKTVANAIERVSPGAWKFEEVVSSAREEKEEVMKHLKLLENLLYEVEMPVHREIKRHMKRSKEELMMAESSSRREVLRKVQEVRRRAKTLIKRYYPYYRGRKTLENQLSWLEEYERAITPQ